MKRFSFCLGMLLISLLMEAKICMPAYFSDYMVLQQKSVVQFHGRAASNREISLSVGWKKQPYTVVSDAAGCWRLDVPTPKAGGPYEISISDGEPLTLHHVMVGEVWLYAGEDHTLLSLPGVSDPEVRVLSVKPSIALAPQQDLPEGTEGWKDLSAEMTTQIPATAYYFACQLHRTLKVPVGLVSCVYPHTPIEAWNSFEALEQVPGYEEHTEMLSSLGFQPDKIEAAYARQREAWFQDLYTHDMGWCNNHQVWAEPKYQDENWKTMGLPGAWETQGLPNFDGVVWFRKTIDIPRAWHRKQLALDLGPIADEDIVFYNGKEIGRGQGDGRRLYTVPRNLVRRGKAVITIRVTNYEGEGGVLGMPDDMQLSVKGKKPLSLAGEWKYLSGLSLSGIAPVPISPSCDPNFPSGLYNALIHPLIGFPMQGIVWHQGISNLENVEEYADLQLSMIADWRDKWQRPDLPFLLVQQGSYGMAAEPADDSSLPFLREAQAAALMMNHTALVVTTDLSLQQATLQQKAFDKGFRLVQASLKQAYGKKRLPEFPSYLNHVVEGNMIRICWKEVGKSFAPVEPLRGFSVAGTDRVFYPATAIIDKKEVIVHSPEVPHPVAVRYNWADTTPGNLFSTSGLPAVPFRTDHW